MSVYELHQHAGKVDYAGWKESGIVVPIFDKDGTLTHASKFEFVDEVIDELSAAQLPDIYPDIALVSNNTQRSHVKEFATLLERRLGVGVYAVSRADGFKPKPHPEMGQLVATEFGVEPSELGVVGDRWMTDVQFGRRLGAGAIALCAKAGQGDVFAVPLLRKYESIRVRLDRLQGRISGPTA